MTLCSIHECNEPASIREYCNRHYMQLYTRSRKEGWAFVKPHDGYYSQYREMYNRYQQMLSRCHNRNHNAYHYYGGRGITVCDRWKASFPQFLFDVGMPPSPWHTLDRINNDGVGLQKVGTRSS